MRLWDLATGTEERRFVKEAKPATKENNLGLQFFWRSSGNGAALSPDGRLLAAGGHGRKRSSLACRHRPGLPHAPT